MLESEKSAPKPEFSHAADAYLRGSRGLKGSSAIAFAEVAQGFHAEVTVRSDGQVANGKSASELARLPIGENQVIRIITRGPDAELALTALEQAVMDGLDSEDLAEVAPELPSFDHARDTRRGRSASPGIAIAPSFVWHAPEISVPSLSEGYHKERNRLVTALIASRQELQKLVSESALHSGSLLAPLFAEQLNELDSPELLEDADVEMRKGYSAMEAFARVVQQHESSREVCDRVLQNLAGHGAQARVRQLPNHPVILIAPYLSPSDYSSLDPERIAGVVLCGDPNQNLAGKILRSREIPCLSDIGAQAESIRSGIPLILDADEGVLVLRPDANDYKTARALVQSRLERKERQRMEIEKPKRQDKTELPPHSVEYFTQVAKFAAELEIPTLEVQSEVKRAGASRELKDEIVIERPETDSSLPRKRSLWDHIFSRK